MSAVLDRVQDRRPERQARVMERVLIGGDDIPYRERKSA